MQSMGDERAHGLLEGDCMDAPAGAISGGERMTTFLWLLLIALAAVLIVLISSALVLSILLIINAIKDIWRQR